MNRRSILQGLLTGLAGLLFWPNSDGVALTSMAHPGSSNEVPVDVELNEESLVRGYFIVENDNDGQWRLKWMPELGRWT